MSAEEMVQIRLEGRCYPVSKRKLIEQSDYFRALYRSGMREALSQEAGGPEVQQLRGLSAPGLRLVLDFINAGGARDGWLLGPRGEQAGGVEEEEEEDMDEVSLLSELVEAASFLQVTSLLQLLLSQVRLNNCLEMYRLAQVYGLPDLQEACLRFMVVHFHEVLCKPHFHLLGSPPPAPGDVGLKQRLREARMTGTPVLVALGDFLVGPLAPHPYQGEPPSMLRYEEMTERWFPLASNLPPDLVNVRGYGSAILDNYLFIVGGYRITSQEISAAHSYNPSTNEWLQVASMNQKRSNFKLVAVNSKLYAIGGQAVSNVECYNPEQDAWNFVAPLPNPLAEFSACECMGKIYVIGGYTTRDRNMNILQYCPSSDIWTLFETCDVHIRKQQMVSVEETIYIVGGCLHELGPNRRSSQSEDMLTVQSYNTITRQWLYLKESTSKSGLNLTCALHNDGIYIMSRDVTLSTSLEHRVFLKYNIFSDSWEAFRRFPAFGHNLLVSSLYLPNKAET
ncbi:kelch-like protein 42 [Cynocephalus volans]|uniref:kelch-like protein 42 n=1 Tax=Cynocephalus volans TaxID=110931 RepID=UPI002FC89A33